MHCTAFAGCLYNSTNSESPVTLEPEPSHVLPELPWKTEDTFLAWEIAHPEIEVLHPVSGVLCDVVKVRYSLEIHLRLTGQYTEVKGPRPAGTPAPLLSGPEDQQVWGFFAGGFSFDWEVITRLAVICHYTEKDTGVAGQFDHSRELGYYDAAQITASVSVDPETGKVTTDPTQDAIPPEQPGMRMFKVKYRVPIYQDVVGLRFFLQTSETQCNLTWEAAIWKAKRNADGELINPEFVLERPYGSEGFPYPSQAWAEYPGEIPLWPGNANDPDGASGWNQYHVDPYQYGII